MSQVAEREVIYRLRVEGADGIAASFERASKAATKAGNERLKEARKTTDGEVREAERRAREVERFDQQQISARLREQSKAADQARRASEKAVRDKERDDKRAADNAIREQRRAAIDAEASLRRADALQHEANKKFLVGTQQAVSSLTSLLRSGVLLWAANEEQADSMLRTLASFEAGAQLFQGAIDGIQAIVTLWEAAEAAAKAYAITQAATTAVGAVSGAAGVATSGAAGAVAGAAGGAAASGGIMGVLGGAFSYVASAASAVAVAFAPLAAIGASVGLALGELLYRITGSESFSVGGALQGAAGLVGLGGYNGAEGAANAERRLAASREASAQKYRAVSGSYERTRQANDFNTSFSMGGASSTWVDSQVALDRFSRLERKIEGAGSPTNGRAAGQLAADQEELLKRAAAARDLTKQSYELQKQEGQERVASLQKSIQVAKAASDAAVAQLKSIEDQQRSVEERVANMSPEDAMTLNTALKKVDRPGFMGEGKVNLPEANLLSGLGLGGDTTRDFFRQKAGEASPLLAEMFRMDRGIAGDAAADASRRLSGAIDTARGTKDVNVSVDPVTMNVELKFNDSSLRENTEKILAAIQSSAPLQGALKAVLAKQSEDAIHAQSGK